MHLPLAAVVTRVALLPESRPFSFAVVTVLTPVRMPMRGLRRGVRPIGR